MRVVRKTVAGIDLTLHFDEYGAHHWRTNCIEFVEELGLRNAKWVFATEEEALEALEALEKEKANG